MCTSGTRALLQFAIQLLHVGTSAFDVRTLHVSLMCFLYLCNRQRTRHSLIMSHCCMYVQCVCTCVQCVCTCVQCVCTCVQCVCTCVQCVCTCVQCVCT